MNENHCTGHNDYTPADPVAQLIMAAKAVLHWRKTRQLFSEVDIAERFLQLEMALDAIAGEEGGADEIIVPGFTVHNGKIVGGPHHGQQTPETMTIQALPKGPNDP